MNLEDRKWLTAACWKCKEITSAGDLKKIARCGCRCIGTAYVYFGGLDLCLIIDEIGGALVGDQKAAYRFLDKLRLDYEIN